MSNFSLLGVLPLCPSEQSLIWIGSNHSSFTGPTPPPPSVMQTAEWACNCQQAAIHPTLNNRPQGAHGHLSQNKLSHHPPTAPPSAPSPMIRHIHIVINFIIQWKCGAGKYRNLDICQPNCFSLLFVYHWLKGAYRLTTSTFALLLKRTESEGKDGDEVKRGKQVRR